MGQRYGHVLLALVFRQRASLGDFTSGQTEHRRAFDVGADRARSHISFWIDTAKKILASFVDCRNHIPSGHNYVFQSRELRDRHDSSPDSLSPSSRCVLSNPGVYDVISKTWIAPSEPVDDIEDGKERAAAHAQEYLRRVAGVELPTLEWKASRSA